MIDLAKPLPESICHDGPFPDDLMPCIRKFFQSENSRPPGLDVYPDVYAADVFFPLQRPAEQAAMMRIARKIKPLTVAELGADKGGSLYGWCKSLRTVQNVIGCEIRGLPYHAVFEAVFPNVRFKWLNKSSYAPETVDEVARFLWGKRDAFLFKEAPDNQIDVLFIDSDKSAYILDFNAYLPLMNPDGIIFVHDVADPVPREGFEAMLAHGNYQHEEIRILTDVDEVKAKRDRGERLTPHDHWLLHWDGASASVGVIYLGEKP